MSKIPITVDYVVAKTVINGLKDWLKRLEDLLDKAVLEKGVNNEQ